MALNLIPILTIVQTFAAKDSEMVAEAAKPKGVGTLRRNWNGPRKKTTSN